MAVGHDHQRIQRRLEKAEQLARIGSWSTALDTLETDWSPGMYRLHGLEPGSAAPGASVVLARVHPDDLRRAESALRAALEHPETVSPEGVTIEYRIVRADGSVHWLRAHGEIEREDGRPVRWVGVAQDVTEQRLTERELHAHYGVSQALRDWESFDEGVMDLLRRLGTALDLPLAALWTWDEASERIVCRAFWSAPDADHDAFEAATRDLTFAVGEGIPGTVWATQEPLVTEDVPTDPSFVRPDVAVDVGVASAVSFAAVGPAGSVAVLVFYSRDRRRTSERLLRTLGGIGRELGRFLARRRAQFEPRRVSERELEVLRLASEGLSGPEIAERLVISPSTVKTHFEHIYEKLGVGDRAGAVAVALRSGLFL
jgi:PAS domain S-box-containing protein